MQPITPRVWIITPTEALLFYHNSYNMINIKNEACNLLQPMAAHPQECCGENYQFKCETKEIRATLLGSFNRHLPGIRNFKLKRAPGSGRTIMRARYGNRTLYAMAYNLCDCFVRFMRDYEMKAE